jgi:hypothetical protein
MIRGCIHIHNIPNWCRHPYSSCGSAKQRWMVGLFFNACLMLVIPYICVKANYYFQRDVHFLWVESFLLLTLHVSGQLNPSSGVHCWYCSELMQPYNYVFCSVCWCFQFTASLSLLYCLACAWCVSVSQCGKLHVAGWTWAVFIRVYWWGFLFLQRQSGIFWILPSTVVQTAFSYLRMRRSVRLWWPV